MCSRSQFVQLESRNVQCKGERKLRSDNNCTANKRKYNTKQYNYDVGLYFISN